ncbi:hypothetical protein ABZV75_25665 [Streptomyces flaveolus]|uniref:hypothetical protein n=1 Tax=Streptomyces flaveolus TaxID=67297 RepID=UPI0033B327AB
MPGARSLPERRAIGCGVPVPVSDTAEAAGPQVVADHPAGQWALGVGVLTVG